MEYVILSVVMFAMGYLACKIYSRESVIELELKIIEQDAIIRRMHAADHALVAAVETARAAPVDDGTAHNPIIEIAKNVPKIRRGKMPDPRPVDANGERKERRKRGKMRSV